MKPAELKSITKLTIDVSDLSATDHLGRLLAETLPDGSVVALIGTLGSGKTRLVQSVAHYWGIEEGIVSSPTFVLLHEYDGNRPIYHFDTYRLTNEDEFRQLSPDDYFEGNGVTFIEWADKYPAVLPDERLEIQIEITGNFSRRFQITVFGNSNIFSKTIQHLTRELSVFRSTNQFEFEEIQEIQSEYR
ncbi:MAG: tRNA (adenosine(37)-N6)-threonylcarbamoyltransferase complex ATPase subunit type 1 TsaE [Planctomycetaceae bacterium]|jgi:tRNA threonylcarbamoyladenosine biosynthesis protein TsaE|nr:tRNA (adenosine(37)-N6)-threonylcarbamoyltransferase complex ATPase subunit type 1 TsaE [Planctomycetaceae bacterium]